MFEYIEVKGELVCRSPLLYKKSDFTAVSSDLGHIYIIGGNDSKTFYTTCEKYDIETDTWSSIANLNIARDSAAVCIINNKYIYAFYGRTKFDKKEVTKTIEKYDIGQDVWKIINLNQFSEGAPSYLSMCVPIDSKTILLFGGFNDTTKTQDCFNFYIDNCLMQKTTSLPTAASFSNSVIQHDHKFYIIGQGNASKYLYLYDIPKRTWKIENSFTLP